jgi:hypothetical protein
MSLDTRSVRVVSIPGQRPGDIISVPRNRALNYALAGQAEPVGWTVEELNSVSVGRPVNRILDTGVRDE